MKTENLIILGGLAAGAYYFFIHKPQQDIAAAYATGAGAVGAVGAGIGDLWEQLLGGFRLPVLQIPVAPPPSPGAEQAARVAAAQREAEARAKAQLTWTQAGGTVAGRAFVLPPPMGQAFGLTVQQPSATRILQTLAAQGFRQPLATVTTLQDVLKVQATRQQEAAIKQDFPTGTRVIGHRTQAGVEIYTLRSPTGETTIVRR